MGRCDHVDLAAPQRPQRIGEEDLAHDHLALWMNPLERLDDRREVGSARVRRQQAKAQRPLEALGGRAGALEHLRELVVRRSRFSEEPLAQRGQRGSTAGSAEQLPAELGLELAQRLAHPRRRQLQPLGGPPEVELLGEREEDPDLP
jgi:hypothetical protein